MTSESIPDRSDNNFAARPHIRWYHHVGDFANLFKAFIGTNYLTLSYGVKESGIGLSILLYVVIAGLTDHCCQLIVKCKYSVIKQICDREFGCSANSRSVGESGSELRSKILILQNKLENSLTFADIGKKTLGRFGSFCVNFFLVLTQSGFCVNYYIFIGNTLHGLLEDHRKIEYNSTNVSTQNYHALVNQGIGSLSINISDANGSGFTDGGYSPPLELLVLSPMPIYVLFTLFRQVRQMSIISFIANISCCIGYISIMIYILSDFHRRDDLQWFRWQTAPIFIGQLAASYEAIGTIIPIESSMIGNRHMFSGCLHGTVIVFTAMIASLSLIGYINFGEDTKQIISLNLPTGTAVPTVINVTLMIGILCTYPLQIYPVIEILEMKLFKSGQSSNDNEEGTETQRLVSESVEAHSDLSICVKATTKVPAWKTNTLRIVITIMLGGIAVIFRNNFAYFNAFIGAFGSTPLAFILPSLFHFLLHRKNGFNLVLIKDISIMIIGCILCLTAVVVSIQQFIN